MRSIRPYNAFPLKVAYPLYWMATIPLAVVLRVLGHYWTVLTTETIGTVIDRTFTGTLLKMFFQWATIIFVVLLVGMLFVGGISWAVMDLF